MRRIKTANELIENFYGEWLAKRKAYIEAGVPYPEAGNKAYYDMRQIHQ